MRCSRLAEKMNERYMSVTEVAEYLGIARNTVLKYISLRGLPAIRIGNLWKIKPSELERWIEENNKK
jgi:excisionase family DNA binding protein